MTRYVAFLRAINVGGRRVRMADLKAHAAALGATSVRTHIASGNLIFESTTRAPFKLAAQLEDGLEARLGFRAEVFLRRDDEVAAIAERGRLLCEALGPEVSVHIGFLATEPSPAHAAAVAALNTQIDAFRVEGTELIWTIRGKVLASQVSGPRIERALGGRVTFRKAGMLLGLVEALNTH